MQKYQNAVQDLKGNVVSGAQVTVYDYGTTNKATIYSDNGSTVIAGSIAVADSNGEFYFYAENGRYSLSVWATNFTAENYTDVLLFDPTDAGIVSVKDYGAKGDGVTDDTAAIQSAIAAINSGASNQLFFPTGVYRITSALNPITQNRVVVYGQGPRQTYINQASNSNTFTFASTTPATARISDITVRDIGINQGPVTNPTAGVALLVTRADRAYFTNIDIRNCFQGIVIEGGADQHWANLTVTGSTSFTGLAAGSNLLEFRNYTGTTEIPSEIFFTNFNIKGYGVYGGAHYHAACIIIRCGDGLFFDTGHCGFAYNSLCYINPQNNASLSCLNLEFSNVYFDGNDGGNNSNSAFWLDGSTTPTVRHIKIDGCTIKNFKGNGINIGLSTCRDVRINNTLIADNGNNGVVFTGVDEVVFSDSTIRANNGNNASAVALSINNVSTGTITGNQVLTGAYTHPYGIDINNGCSDLVIANNAVGIHTTDIRFVSGATRLNFKANRKIGSNPTVVSSDGFILPLGFDVVEVTGNTNFSNIGGPIIDGYTVTLKFTGTPTAFDAAGNLKLTANFVATADSTLTVMGSGSYWTEVSRAAV